MLNEELKNDGGSTIFIFIIKVFPAINKLVEKCNQNLAGYVFHSFYNFLNSQISDHTSTIWMIVGGYDQAPKRLHFRLRI